MEILLVVLMIAVICVFFHFYGKFLASMIVKKARKTIEKGKLNDKLLIKSYNNCNSLSASFIIFGPILYLHMKKAYVQVKDIYFEEIQKRNLNI